jgi:hypothetical protein
MLMISGLLVGMGSHALWNRLSDMSDRVVVLFGLLLWAICVFCVFCLGMRAISTTGCKRSRHEPGQGSRRRFRRGLKSVFSNDRVSKRRQLKSSYRWGARRQVTAR